MTDPLFTIITITKDNLSGLRATARSVQAQSYKNYEWIVIDGNSNDGTALFLQTQAKPHRLISEPDDGIYDAMNKGLDLAHGEYVLFLNAGDCLSDHDILSTLSTAIDAHHPEFLYGDALESNGFYKKARSHKKIALGMFTHHQSMLYARRSIGTLRYNTHYKITADYDFTVNFLQANRICHYVPCAICIFEDGGVSQKNREIGRMEQFRIRKICGMLPVLPNAMILAMQYVSASLREQNPALYRFMRKFRG